MKKTRNRNGKGQGGIAYPWEEWFTKKKVTLKRGKDFNSLPHSMAQQMRNAARLHGIKVSIKVLEKSIEAEIKTPLKPVKKAKTKTRKPSTVTVVKRKKRVKGTSMRSK